MEEKIILFKLCKSIQLYVLSFLFQSIIFSYPPDKNTFDVDKTV